jgi:Divergent InlB B-repeat domain
VLLLLVLAICLAAAASASAAPPANDSFAAPTAITLGSTTSATNVEATKESGEPDHAGNPGGHSVWFSWTAPATETVGVQIPCSFGFGLESLIAVYTGSSLGALTSVASNAVASPGACSPFSETPEADFEAQAGTEYRIAVDGKNGAEAAFSLTLAGPPANDDFADATTIPAEPPTYGVSGNLRLAGKEIGEPDHAGDADGHSVWFNWTPTTSGPVIVSTCDPFGQIDSVLAVYTGSAVDSLTPVGSNDDALDPGSPECLSRDSEVRLAAVAGTTYRIALDSTGGMVGRFNLRIHGRPANDSFANPQVLSPGHSGGTGVTDNKLATKEAGEPDHAGDPGGTSVWYSWTPSEAGPVTVSACPLFETPLETVTAVYTGSAVGALTPVASSAGEGHKFCGSAAGSQASFSAKAGTTYRIAVDGKGGSEGHFQLSLLGPATNDAFAHPQVLPGEGPYGFGGDTRGASKEAGEPNHAGDPGGHSVWFSWTAPKTGPFVLSACPYGEFDGDPLLAVYTGNAVNALTPVAADKAGGSFCNPHASQVEVNATAGTEYKIAVDAADGVGGIFSLNIDGTPENDDFAAARILPAESNFASGSTRFATKQAGEPDHAGDPGGHSVWFSWTPSTSGPVALLACPGTKGGPYASSSGMEPLLGVYTGDSLAGLTEVTSHRGGPITETIFCPMEGATEVHFEATAGSTYKIAVDAAAGGEAPFSLAIERGATNDDFAAARALEGSLPLYGSVDNRFATRETGEPNHAGAAGAHSVWFDWTATVSEPVFISTCTNSGQLDPVLGVYTGAAVNSLTEVASDDDGPPRYESCRTTDSGVEVNAVAGTTYRIAVDGKGGTVGTASLEIEGPPANDDFDRAESLGAARSTGSWDSNRFATEEPGEPTIAGLTHDHSIWFKWTAPRDGQFTVDTCGSSIDTLLGVYTGGSVGSLTEVVSNDEAGGECSPGSRVVFTATKGTVYRIAVDGKGGATGAISLHLDGPPANDDFAEATVIPADGSYEPGASALATAEAGEPTPGGHSVWYSWTPNLSGPTSLEVCGVGFTPSFGVFTGAAPASLVGVSTSVATADCAHSRAVEFDAVAGTSYRIEVGGAEGGRFELRLLAANSRLRLLTVRAGGEGSGSVNSATAGISCGATCRYDIAPGTSLTLTADPSPGSAFAGWSGGGCSGTGPCTVDFQSDATVTATFAPGTGGGGTGEEKTPEAEPPTGNQSPPSGTQPAPVVPKVTPKPLQCHKGFKKVRSQNGKARCVKKAAPKPEKHRKRHQQHGA